MMAPSQGGAQGQDQEKSEGAGPQTVLKGEIAGLPQDKGGSQNEECFGGDGDPERLSHGHIWHLGEGVKHGPA